MNLKRHSIQGIEVLQRTSDGYFNITELTKAFNAYFCTNKRVQDFFDNQQTKDFIAEIYNREVLTNEPSKERVLNSSLDNAKERVLNKDILGYSVKLKRGGRGHSDSTWVHPMLFLKYMIHLSPSFEYRALQMVQDNLINCVTRQVTQVRFSPLPSQNGRTPMGRSLRNKLSEATIQSVIVKF